MINIPKKILIACGSGIATSTVVKEKVKKTLKEENIKAEFKQTSIGQIKSNLNDIDLIIPTSSISIDVEVPIVLGIPLLSGVGEKETLEKIIKILKEED